MNSYSRRPAVSPGQSRPGSPWGASPRGVSLVELMVVLLVSVIVTMVAFTLYKITLTYYLKEDAGLERDQNLRAALSVVSRDARMAGNGFILLGSKVKTVQAWVKGRAVRKTGGGTEYKKGEGWFAHDEENPPSPPVWGAQAIFGVDGGDKHPDSLTIFRSEVESGAPLGRLSAAYDGGGTLSLAESSPPGALRDRDLLALVNGERAVILELNENKTPGEVLTERSLLHINQQPDARFTAPAGTPPPWSSSMNDWKVYFPAGSSVYNLREAALVTYYVDEDKNNLMAVYHDREDEVAAASNIEDFQVYYYLDGVGVKLEEADKRPYAGIDSGVLKDKRVRAVALGLVSRSNRQEKLADRPTHSRPALFNRDPGSQSDEFPRNVLTGLIFLRNS